MELFLKSFAYHRWRPVLRRSPVVPGEVVAVDREHGASVSRDPSLWGWATSNVEHHYAEAMATGVGGPREGCLYHRRTQGACKGLTTSDSETRNYVLFVCFWCAYGSAFGWVLV